MKAIIYRGPYESGYARVNQGEGQEPVEIPFVRGEAIEVEDAHAEQLLASTPDWELVMQ